MWKESLRGKESWRCEDAEETEKRRSVLTKLGLPVASRKQMNDTRKSSGAMFWMTPTFSFSFSSSTCAYHVNSQRYCLFFAFEIRHFYHHSRQHTRRQSSFQEAQARRPRPSAISAISVDEASTKSRQFLAKVLLRELPATSCPFVSSDSKPPNMPTSSLYRQSMSCWLADVCSTC